MTATPWATIEQVAALTGATVTALQRGIAVHAIETNTGLIEEVEREDISDRDRYWLKLAVAYQASWLLGQPDFLERTAVSTVAQDGQSATAANPDWLVLAPMARKAIKRLSWRGTRAMLVPPPGRIGTVDPLTSSHDGAFNWGALS